MCKTLSKVVITLKHCRLPAHFMKHKKNDLYLYLVQYSLSATELIALWSVAAVSPVHYFCQEEICINGRQVCRQMKIRRELFVCTVRQTAEHTSVHVSSHLFQRHNGLSLVGRFCLETDLHCSYPRLLNCHPSNKSATNKVDKTTDLFTATHSRAAVVFPSITMALSLRRAADREALIRDDSLRYLLLYTAARRELDQVSQAIRRHISLKSQLPTDEPCDDGQRNSLAYTDRSHI
jgi:hypothetical protein